LRSLAPEIVAASAVIRASDADIRAGESVLDGTMWRQERAGFDAVVVQLPPHPRPSVGPWVCCKPLSVQSPPLAAAQDRDGEAERLYQESERLCRESERLLRRAREERHFVW
jgi:hypothetical protein